MDPGTPNRIEQMIEENHPTVGERQSARWHLALGPSYARRSHQKEEEWQEHFCAAMEALLKGPEGDLLKQAA